jgi:DNA topoisomerase-1
MSLIIVESPTKARTIKGFLDSKYKVESSFGHIRDLPKSSLGIDIENNFEIKYVIPAKARKNVNALKEKAKKEQEIILGTDEDREGEAIAYHLKEILADKKSNKRFLRIVFHEITKEAILEALSNPRDIDLNLVDAQKARRVLDRLVGYKLSPLLWKKIAPGLSAGRVQSVALKLIVDREKEIKNFKPTEYWEIFAKFKINNDNAKTLELKLVKINNKKIGQFDIKNKDEAENIKNKILTKNNWQVTLAQKKETYKNPLAPYMTATLQQDAAYKLGFSAKKTMMLAQQLYEGIKIKGQGQVGLITYMRTDSVNLAQKAVSQIRDFIEKKIGKNYLNKEVRLYKNKSKLAQEAHEAIRPTQINLTPEDIKNDLTGDQYKLYQLIWSRTLATQMAPAVFDSTLIQIEDNNKEFTFETNGQILKFDGFLKIYQMRFKENQLPEIFLNDQAEILELSPKQKFTKPPSRFTESSLIKTLKDLGIGRPSTYAPIIETLFNRRYIERDEKKKLVPQEMGFLVSDLLSEHFPQIVDVNFTARMEDNLDEIASGKKEYLPMIKNFYEEFEKLLKEKYQQIAKKEDQKTDKVCPKCGAPVVIKIGRFGKFYSCSRYPQCDFTDNIIISTGVQCPQCKEGEIVSRQTRKGKTFYSCSRYPQCKYAMWDKPTGEVCPKCGSLMGLNRWQKLKCSNKSCPTNSFIYNKNPVK